VTTQDSIQGTVAIDHVALPSGDAGRSAQFLAGLLGLADAVPEGPDGDMFGVHLAGGTMVLYMTSPVVVGHHVALRTTVERFEHLVAGLRRAGVAFGNDPTDQHNGETTDCLGTNGRVYFRDPDGHLLEVVASAPS
jgi:catechol 2,3-dioxygenase-like lactoylglutathione lyase family enzyme